MQAYMCQYYPFVTYSNIFNVKLKCNESNRHDMIRLYISSYFKLKCF